MEEQPVIQLEEQVQLLINKYKDLSERNKSLNSQIQELVIIKNNNTQTITELRSAIERLEKELAEKNETVVKIQQEAEEYKDRLSKLEKAADTTTSRLKDILSQFHEV